MPDAQLSTFKSPHPSLPSPADRSLPSSKKSSPDYSPPATYPRSSTPQRKDQTRIPPRTISPTRHASPVRQPTPSLPYSGRPGSPEIMPAIVDTARPAKASSSTNNLFSSSCQPMRNTPNGESFAKDFIDIFTTLMISLPLKSHRVRFKAYPFTFTTEEALQNMASLRLTQTNRMDDPKNAGRIVTTTTSTSFSIGKEMARTIGAQFVQARLVEAAVDAGSSSFDKDKSLWQITPKGMHVLHRFANRNGIASNTLSTLLASNLTTMNLIILERDDVTDQILESASLVELIFRRFAGSSPNVPQLPSRSNGRSPNGRDSTGSGNSDFSSLPTEHFDGYTGVQMRDGRRVGDPSYFTGQDALIWLLECCTTVKESEAHHLAAMFLKHDLIVQWGSEQQRAPRGVFETHGYYVLTERGKRMAGWTRAATTRSSSGSRSPPQTGKLRKSHTDEDAMSLVAAAADNGRVQPVTNGKSHLNRTQSNGRIMNGTNNNERATTRETSTAKLQQILNDPALLTLFREFLRQNFCEENLQFYRETGEFIKSVRNVDSIEQVKAFLATAFSHYNAFLAQGSPCELNLEHSLRLDLAARMAKQVDDNDTAIRAALDEVVGLFERARSQVLRLMASDSVPKFVQTWRYRQLYGEEHPNDSAPVTPPPENIRL